MMPTVTDAQVTVVVPTRDRPGQLANCLHALTAQTVHRMEIIVVDDGSVADQQVLQTVASVPGVRLLRASGIGPAAARNLGAAAASAPVVCFTDDDCRPVPQWAALLLDRIRSGADAAAGPTRIGEPRNAVSLAAQAVVTHLTEWSVDPDTARMQFAPTCNLAVRAELCRALPFDATYIAAAGEDREWCCRLLAAGHSLVFAPGALVRHDQRRDVRAFWRQQVRFGRAGYRVRATRRELPRAEPLGFYTALLRRGFAAGPGVGAMVVATQIATAVGVGMEAFASRRTRVRPPGP